MFRLATRSAGPEHQRLHPRARRDRVDVGQPAGVLDLRVDADPADRQPVRRSPAGVSSRSSAWTCETSVTFGSTMRSSERTRRGHHLDDVGMRPRRRPVVDANTRAADPTSRARPAPAPPVCGPRPWRRQRRRPRGRGTPRPRAAPWPSSIILRAAAGNRKAGSAGSIRGFPQPHSYPLSHGVGQQGVRGPARGDGGPGPRRRVDRPRPRRRDQHQHRAPAAAGARAGRRIAQPPKDLRPDPARHRDRSQCRHADHRQRVAAQVRAAARRGAGARPGARHPGPRRRSRTCPSSPGSTSSSSIWASSRSAPATGW